LSVDASSTTTTSSETPTEASTLSTQAAIPAASFRAGMITVTAGNA
jgi:hypothetical protein